ncbi:PREDICTED: uncharacterized protein LOC104766605 [Camelina sativa]|uniref:Uncharacterized protein LOC104766605 n=1 Tax=Camelina sativa TaxID=90675 RepID=A0ABM1RCU3_CAMSA|nr:PREDICTED: uncharacterized protein LOC104766605 [Camelina sativa]
MENYYIGADGPLSIPPMSPRRMNIAENTQQLGIGNPMELGAPSTGEFGDSNMIFAAIRDTLVPTVLRDSDALPYFDEPGEEDFLNRALKDADYEGDRIFVRRIFKNKEDCTTKMAIYAIRGKFHFIHAIVFTLMVMAVCVSYMCPWRVYVHKMEDIDVSRLEASLYNTPVVLILEVTSTNKRSRLLFEIL